MAPSQMHPFNRRFLQGPSGESRAGVGVLLSGPEGRSVLLRFVAHMPVPSEWTGLDSHPRTLLDSPVRQSIPPKTRRPHCHLFTQHESCVRTQRFSEM